MSSPEVEKFEITEDDLADELNPSRRKFKRTKNQAIFGVWADSDEENDDRPKFKSGRGKKDYVTPVNFVSGGVKIGDRVTKEGKEGEEELTSESEDEDDKIRAAAALAARSKKGGARSAYKATKTSESGFGDWERHTKGIGQRLLEKMGHVQGKGLGKNLQGISTPVEAAKRRGRGAVGMYGSEKSERAEKDFPTKPDSDEEKEREFSVKLQQWKKGEGERKRKTKYVTADELIASGGAAATETKKKVRQVQSELSKVKVIDMTGREQRVLSGYHAMTLKHDKPMEDDVSRMQEKKQFDLPELLHNLDLLVGMVEDEILQNDKKLNYEQSMVVNLESEHNRLTNVCDQDKNQIERLREIMNIVQECEDWCKMTTSINSQDKQPLDKCAHLFLMLQEKYYEEYRLYELSSLAVAMVYPLMKNEFEGWEPLKKPRQCIATIHQWKEILQEMTSQSYAQGRLMSGSGAGVQTDMEPYDKLVWQVVVPCIRNSIMRVWQVRDSDSLLEVLEAWTPLLPHWILCHILDQLIFPRLNVEVDSWNPLADTVPIHAWIHPWLPIMGDRLEALYGPIRQKLASALTNWHPSDPSAKLILQPWVGVFRPGQMDMFVVKSILPKLALCMQEFIINPHQQQLDAWHWVMSWLEIVPHIHMVSMLEKTFFPRWLSVLSTWLSSSPNYDEVTKWYIGWKSMFSEQLVTDPVIKEQLNRALELMNHAVCVHHQPGARENIAYLTSTERRRDFEPTPPISLLTDRKDFTEPARGLTASTSVPTNFKDLVERRAEENNIVFVPIPGKTHEAKNVYRFGHLQMYIDRGLIFIYENGRWGPVSLNTLIEKTS